VRPPPSTYRIQLHSAFTLLDALGIADYLDDLGVGAVYLSPVLQAQRGSTHGYDLVDPSRIDAARGGEGAFVAWADEVGRRGMGRLVDFVPNHMGVGSDENAWWNDVLQDGPQSPYADFFDVDWSPPQDSLLDTVLLPVLGAPYGQTLEQGELQLARTGGAFWVRYFDHRWPVGPPSAARVLRAAAATLPPGDPCADGLTGIAEAFARLPDCRGAPRERRRERAGERDAIKRRLESLLHSEPQAAAVVDAAVLRLNGAPGVPRAFDDLDALLLEQSYRLADWHVAADEINYRRFFDVSGLAAVRMEDPDVFAATHALVLRLVGQRRIDGIRLDHTDGLCDPAGYFRHLQDAASAALGGADPGIYLVAEKILEPGEALPRAWSIDGTTGYDFLADVNGLWVDPGGEGAITRAYREVTGDTDGYEAIAADAKRAVLGSDLASEVNLLGQAVERLASARRRSRDFTLRSVTAAVLETLAAFPVYRTFVRPDGAPDARDERHVKAAIASAKRRRPAEEGAVFDFLEDMLLLRTREPVSDDARAAQVAFCMRFQQVSGPVMAKGIEDTAYYRYPRLLSLNEVGGYPGVFGTSIARFHEASAERRERWKGSMLATSTHDTKRGEDARARLAVLSEVPDRWRSRVAAWEAIARSRRSPASEVTAPDRYYFYQAVVAGLPFGLAHGGPLPDDFVVRACAHMAKATKEEKRETGWTHASEAYDEAVQRFTREMLCEPRFSDDLVAFVASIARAGATNSLGQTALKLTSPGVPDVYQGTELWCLDFCDPDNRRPVDYPQRRAYLRDLRSSDDRRRDAATALEHFEDGRIKMLVSHALLRMRRDMPALFLDGSYEKLEANAPFEEHVVAFSREGSGRRVVTAVTRGSLALVEDTERWSVGGVWGDAILALPAGRYADVLTGQTLTSHGSVALRDLFGVLPVAVLALLPGGTP